MKRVATECGHGILVSLLSLKSDVVQMNKILLFLDIQKNWGAFLGKCLQTTHNTVSYLIFTSLK